MSEEQFDWVENSAIGQERIELIQQKLVYHDLREKSNALLEQITVEFNKLRELCNHDPQDLLPKSDYTSGGYDYTGNTDYWDECQICGERVNKYSKSDGYYG